MRTRQDAVGTPTLATVAAVAGVSPSTASRVVNGSPTVAPNHRRAVESAIAQLGYVPNRAARSLVTRRTDSVGLVVREPAEFGVSDPYVSSIVVAASQSLVGTGRHLVVMMAQNDADHAATGGYVRSGHVDGVILVSVHADDPLPAQLLRAGIPTVIGGRPPMPLAGLSYVDADNVAGGRLATERLIGQGRRRVAMISGPTDMTAALDRRSGYREALRDAGRGPEHVGYGAFTRPSGERAMRELLDQEPTLDAVFAASDVMAAGALRVLRAAGRRVPDDVAVVGYDDVELAQCTEPPLTTVRQPAADQARAMVEMLLAQIAGDPAPPPRRLPIVLVERDSG